MALYSSWRLQGIFWSVILGATLTAFAQEEFALRFSPRDTGLELRWQVRLEEGAVPPKFEIQRSTDCKSWTTIASGLTSPNGVLSSLVNQDGQVAFYRIKSDQKVPLTALGGEEVFGYSRALKQRLAELGQISVDTFAGMYPVNTDYLNQIDFDVTTAAYWQQFNSAPPPLYWDPATGMVNLRDYRLNDTEKALLQKHGFLASGRLGSTNCLAVYYDIFKRDLPVFVTTDSILQAWHRSFDSILQDLETMYLSHYLAEVLNGMAAQIPTVAQAYGIGPLRQSVLDADYFITVARSLLAGTQTQSSMGQEALVSQTLSAVASLKTQPFNLFGRLDKDPLYEVDFSQFKVRGHYTNSRILERYFRAMMWCGRTDFRVAGNPAYASPRELGAALVLRQVLVNSGQYTRWQDIDRVVQVLVGRADSMNFAQLDALLNTASVKILADIKSQNDLVAIQSAIENGSLGFQDILSDLYYSPLSPERVVLPRSFTVLGQRFTQDSWAMGSVVFDKVFWDTDGIPDARDKVWRRIPSCLDIAFAVFGNNQTVPDLVARLTNPDGRKFRDGLPYQHNLAAVRQVIDSQSPTVWSDNVYNAWLGALRELSLPTASPAFPQCMRTRAWAMKTLNTQLASWTHLRHDTILYVKQSYTPPMTCSYPSGYVEPVPSFWRQMNLLAARMYALLESIPMSGSTTYEDRYGQGVIFTSDLGTIKANQLNFLNRFAKTMTTLEIMANKELRQEPFSTVETDFLKDVVEPHSEPYTHKVTYNGWYPKLYYWDVEGFDWQSDALANSLPVDKLPRDAEKGDALVADVHTDASDPLGSGDPGMILMEGVGNVNCLVAAIDSGPDRAIYLGPVLSHYEFEQPVDERLSDEDWRSMLSSGLTPSPPPWTQSYLQP